MKMSSSASKPNLKGGTKSKIICKYFIQGKCIKGEACPYLHSQIEKTKEMITVECPMYSIGFCKNGPVCHFLHIKKDKYKEEEPEEKNTTSTTPNLEEQNNSNDNDNGVINIQNENFAKNDEKVEKFEKKDEFPVLPIWYVEHYFDKPISMIFSDLEQKNLPEIAALKKKYGFTNIEPNLPIMQPLNKKNQGCINMNTINKNFNNLNLNLAFNENGVDKKNTDIKYDNYKFKKDSIEYLINKEENIFYYLIRCKNIEEIKKSSGSNTIELPQELYDQYKDVDIKKNNLTIVLIIYNDENENLAGIALVKYALKYNKNNEQSENMFKIEWLWRTKLSYSQISHLMNRADDDHFFE